MHVLPGYVIGSLGLSLLGLQRLSSWRGWTIISTWLALTCVVLALFAIGFAFYCEFIRKTGYFVHARSQFERQLELPAVFMALAAWLLLTLIWYAYARPAPRGKYTRYTLATYWSY